MPREGDKDKRRVNEEKNAHTSYYVDTYVTKPTLTKRVRLAEVNDRNEEEGNKK